MVMVTQQAIEDTLEHSTASKALRHSQQVICQGLLPASRSLYQSLIATLAHNARKEVLAAIKFMAGQYYGQFC